MSSTVKPAIIIKKDSHGCTTVRFGTGTGDIFHLTGIASTPAPVGAKGRLFYRTGPTYALWFFERDDTVELPFENIEEVVE